MSRQRPPKVATWLLQKFLYGRHSESVIGDLMQLHAEGRSRGWYWSQAVRALMAGAIEALRANGRSLAMALAIGWAVIFLWRELNAIYIESTGDIYRAVRAQLHGARNDTLLMVWGIGALLRLVSFGVSGWLAARLSPRCPRLAVAILAASVMMWPMPWQQIRLDWDVQWLVHYGTALVGIFVGAWIASTLRAKQSPTKNSAAL